MKYYNMGDKILLMFVFLMMMFLIYERATHKTTNPTPNSIILLEGSISGIEKRVRILEQRK
jgi:hypothetical protein